MYQFIQAKVVKKKCKAMTKEVLKAMILNDELGFLLIELFYYTFSNIFFLFR